MASSYDQFAILRLHTDYPGHSASELKTYFFNGVDIVELESTTYLQNNTFANIHNARLVDPPISILNPVFSVYVNKILEGSFNISLKIDNIVFCISKSNISK